MDVLRLPRSETLPRIARLATLPIFYELTGKAVLLAGGSEGAAWKAELLAAAGAEVHVFCQADALSEPFRALLAGDKGDTGSFVHHDCDWQSAYFRHFSLAVGDCDEDEAMAFHDRAREAGVPVNVIDKPEFCQFKFGSIVNRSPVVVAISTDGAAPILGQAIRRRVEAVLPARLSAWAGLARTIRGEIGALLRPGTERRRFWEDFVDRAFGATEPGEDTVGDLVRVARGVRASAPRVGRVTLVGAGPGDAELLTLKAVRALQGADVIAGAGSTDAAIFELGRREAERIQVDCGRGEDVARIAALVAEGRHVVMLVPGDAASEAPGIDLAARLERSGVPVIVVAGVPAGNRPHRSPQDVVASSHRGAAMRA